MAELPMNQDYVPEIMNHFLSVGFDELSGKFE